MAGGTVTVNETPLLARPPTVTTTMPVVAPAGTGTTMLVADQLVAVAAVPLSVTALVPSGPPQLFPAVVTPLAARPPLRERLVMVGGTVTVNDTPVLAKPPTATTPLPV